MPHGVACDSNATYIIILKSVDTRKTNVFKDRYGGDYEDDSLVCSKLYINVILQRL
jgi:hypothetical protein